MTFDETMTIETPEATISTPAGGTPLSASLIASGIRPLDYRLGGILPNRPYVISGNPGTGKSVSCLEFAHRGIEAGEQVLLITHDDPADVLATAAFLGMDIDRPLREERLVLLRFQLDFVRRLARATSPDAVFAEMRRHLAPFDCTRIAIDSLVPFLDAGPASNMVIHGLIQFLDERPRTSLLTFPGDLSGLYDRRLEPLMQRAAGVFHLTSDSERNHKLEVRKIRYEAPSTKPVTFRVLSGAGMVVITDPDSSRVAPPPDVQQRLALVNMAEPLPADLVSVLRHHFDVSVRDRATSAFSELVRQGVGALLLSVRRDVIDVSLRLIRDMRQANTTVPVVLITPYVLRSADRARALRAGADDFLSTSLAPSELIARLQNAIKRGHWHDLASPLPEPAMILQPTSDGRTYVPMSGDGFAQSMRTYLEREDPPFFALFGIRAEQGDVDSLARLVLDAVRIESGDLVGIMDDRVFAYLDSARPKDLGALRIRLQEQALRSGLGELEIESMGFPANEDEVRSLVYRPTWS